MTSRQVYEGTLVELNKVNAPSLLLEDFNYLFNKAIYQYINKKYNIYDVNQQSTDDMRVLKATAILTPAKASDSYAVGDNILAKNSLYGATYEVTLPTDYLHLLNCVCNFKVNKNFKCYDEGSYVQFGATRLTSDIWSQIINNFYMRPSYKKPYYYIHNVNKQVNVPTNPNTYDGLLRDTSVTPDSKYVLPTGGISTSENNGQLVVQPLYYKFTTEENSDPLIINGEHVKYNDNELYYLHTTASGGLGKGTDGQHSISVGSNNETAVSSNLSRSLLEDNDLVKRKAAVRYGNASEVRLEIRYGKDDTLFKLENVYVDYIKTPQHIRLTQEQLDLTEDTSQMMEFPDYVCQEIINELVKLCMENASDPRLQTNLAVNQTIANPAQQQQTTQQ